MSRLTDLLQNVSHLDPVLGAELTNEYRALLNSRNYGLVFEKHKPEAVELPSVKPKRGSTVRILPQRGESDMSKADLRLWTVSAVTNTLGRDDIRRYTLVERGVPDEEREVREDVPGDDLIVVVEFQDTIYPGLIETDSVIYTDDPDKPAHVVFNAENYHALQLLTYTHRHAVDVIYIDPPYNTGAKDWKYNNDYVGTDDLYRHSKWLSFMERRLKQAKELLNPDDSVLIVTIDEKEYLRLGLLLEQVFPEADIQMVTSVINRAGSSRNGRFARVDEYIFYVFLGNGAIQRTEYDMLDKAPGQDNDDAKMPTVWFTAVRRGTASGERASWENGFYPVLVDSETLRYVGVGEPLGAGVSREDVELGDGITAIWPLGPHGKEQVWRFSADRMREYFEAGTARLGKVDKKTGQRSVTYLQPGTLENIANGTFVVTGRSEEGAVKLALGDKDKVVTPRTVWDVSTHFSRNYGSQLVRDFLGEKRFDFPKSLYLVEDTLRFVLKEKPNAIILDFFAGTGTTAHAVMRLNHQDGGARRSISITNNEVSADEQIKLRKQGLRPGDSDWEAFGICDYVTKPRITAAITGKQPNGEAVAGDYSSVDEFPMSHGFPENARFYTLTYLSPNVGSAGRAFGAVPPFLWLAAGQQGRVIDDLGERGWDATDYYGVVEAMDYLGEFVDAVNSKPKCRVVFIVTDDDGAFELAAQAVRDDIKTYRLYESYLANFEIVNR
ncbi:MAG: hypothetical protein L0K43_07040 [Bifidobacterium crudilactis]|nr:hypothetical protein [Bifidobacterium crudilactis]